MTKKPSEKNKAWEKDRRDRLNKTFDELAKLLPKYDASVAWSKIEIIQKAITFITDLQKKQEDYLKANDPKLLRDYEAFGDCLKFYQERNAQLTELLKKNKVALPAVVLPQLLVDKPELLPKVEKAAAPCQTKPKRQRNRAKKREAETKKEDANEKDQQDSLKLQNGAHSDLIEEQQNNSSSQVAEKITKEPTAIEMTTKPIAIVTAISAETPTEAAIALPPPCVPAKPLLLWLKKPSFKARVRAIPRPMLRKCYPHPDRMLRWSAQAVSHRKLAPKRISRRMLVPRKKPKKGIKVDLIPDHQREQSISPTAAFLLSFPVVTPSALNGKNVENAENSVSLENLNNFFTTEEYSKFCDQIPEKLPTPPPVESPSKPLISGKPMTLFTVSAITRPSSPKKSHVTCNQSPSKRISDAPCVLASKVLRTSPADSFQSCYSLPNQNPMIGSTSMVTSAQYVPLSSVPIPGTNVKLEPKDTTVCSKGISRYNQNQPMSSTEKVQLNAPRNATSHPTVAGKSLSKIPPSSATKPPNKLVAGSYYSPTKSFFYDFPAQPPAASSSDPLISATASAKPPSFLSFPSIKAEFPWLPSSATSSATPTTPSTTTASCNLGTNFTPFDLASIVCDTLTATSFTFSLATPKSTEPAVVEAGSKPSTGSKCGQMNLFLPYEDSQYTPSFSAAKADNQIFYDCEQSKPQPKSHVNWMTSPATDYTGSPAAAPLPPIDFGSQFPAATNFDFSFGCRKDSYDDDNQFINWSPTKPLNTDFSTTYSFENFGSSEAPPNKTVKQIFSVSQLVDQSETPQMKKALSKATSALKTTPVKQTFSNIYSAESLIAKKDNHRMTSGASFYNTDQEGYPSSNYFYNYPSTQNCSQVENDYLGATTTAKTTSILPAASAPVIPPFEAVAGSSANNFFSHSISSNTNDPYDPTYFPSSNYNHPSTGNWSAKASAMNGYSQNQLPTGGQYATVDPSCQQNANVSGNLTNFNLSSICPEIDSKGTATGW